MAFRIVVYMVVRFVYFCLNSVSYVFLLLCLCILVVCMLCSVYPVFIVPTGILRLP